jgi:3-methyladenine DNA glycosylase AlkD
MAPHVAGIIAELHGLADPRNMAGMARFGIVAQSVLGISVGQLRAIARRVGRNHDVAEELWAAGIFEARLLAAFVAEPARLTRRQANAWARDFECWADCDGLCIHLFRKTPFAHELAGAWSRRREEMVKRAGFTMMATLAVHDKEAADEVFCNYLVRVREESNDERHNVKKGVNWALRQIGKRNRRLNREAIRVAKQIQRQDSRAARWIASDALRELYKIRSGAAGGHAAQKIMTFLIKRWA